MLEESTARYAHAKKIGDQDGVAAADRYWQILMSDELPREELDRRYELLSGLFSRSGRGEASYFMRGGIFEMPMGMTQKLPDSVVKWNVLQYKQAFDKAVRQRLSMLLDLYQGTRHMTFRGEIEVNHRHLFNRGEFTLHSGDESTFLIDCDALTDEDLAALAHEVSTRLRWRKVVGIPEGGLRFAEKLSAYNIGSTELPVLIADDVWTTGRSMREMSGTVLRDRGTGTVVQGVVIFARDEVDGWVHALFQMTSRDS
jgi:hypothetical protein